MTEAQRDLLWLLHLHEQASERARRRLRTMEKRFLDAQTNASNVRMCHARICYAQALRAQRQIAADVDSVRQQLRARGSGKPRRRGRKP